LAPWFAIAVSLTLAPAANAQDAIADFYRGKAVSFIVGLPPGGSFDLYARLVAGHIGKHIPGRPNVVVQNMPGAGSLAQANHVYAVAPQDGTVIGAPSSNVPLQPLLNAAGVKYDSLKFQWLPTPADSPHVLFVRSTSPIRRVEDMRDRETLIGALAPGSTPTVTIGLYNEVYKTRMKAVLGYAGLPDVMLAMERGEVEGYATMPFDTLRHSYKRQFESGEIRVLSQSGETRLPALPDVPAGRELASNEDDLRLLGLGTASSKMTFPYMLGPGVPKERVEALRRAFMAALADPELIEEARRREMNLRPISAERVSELVHAAFATPAPVVARLRAIYERLSK
jgi:tripartite-type tricarboxylate transporter receptor subunit TctC